MPKSLKNFCKLLAWGGGLWLFFAIITPRLLALSPAWQHYDAVQEKYGLDSGALYYSDVPVTLASEEATRAAVRAGMAERRRLAMLERKKNEEQ